ncbi:MAG: hypothetical protein ACI4JK_12735 [Oscillospiraceae bacterium]
MSVYIEEICRCMFIKWQNSIISVSYENDSFSVLSYLGETTWGYSKDFWETWKKVVSYAKGQAVDFCVIGDSPMGISDDLISMCCDAEHTRWNKRTIQRALDSISNMHLFNVFDLDGNHIAGSMAMFPDEPAVDLYVYTHIQDTPEEIASENKKNSSVSDDSEPTEFAEYFIRKLEDDERRRSIKW